MRHTRLVGESPAMLAVKELITRFAPTPLPILVMGETGTGKELAARLVHELSGRKGPFVDVDCGALPTHLIESALFGHERGAFTGAVARSVGLIRAAEGGTLFLDELASLPLGGQAKLLRVLETGELRPVGATRPKRVDFRLVATVQDDVDGLLNEDKLRLDLLQRVAGAVIRMPTLAERREDIGPLTRYFAEAAGATITRDAERQLRTHRWVGNVRELKWTVMRALAVAQDGSISASTLAEALRSGPRSLFLSEARIGGHDFATFVAVCKRHRGDPERIANAMGVAKSTVYRRVRAEGLDLQLFRETGVVPPA